VQIIALEQDKDSVNYEEFKPSFPLALLIGNEVKGVSKKVLEKCHKIIELPMRGKKESLNVSVAFGVAGYQIIKYKK
jgi:tRNA G18 (ribose-2'-O)-methylase SpoU